ncbi:hypothetical protein YDYSY3_08770 [Paenibacillus chitinolyticus]|uniref:hypothetical protein n=1 Tax=Paenibacillus chitinolyticus TaxID=79263 RepID=UPI0026E4A890|nr:hypothetical protein [Paenibacillus chitinolyticus]GKS09877.1 hypothetical protein YDYSY3_08770 [Paenibacillus chitinolyticus]
MGRTSSFTRSDLAWECAQVKRKLLNDARKGRINRLSKSAVFDLIAARPRIDLKSPRMLWASNHREYLDSWFAKLEEEIKVIVDTPSDSELSITRTEDLARDNTLYQAKIAHLTQLVNTYKEAMDQLRVENTKYRELISQRFGHIDDL